MKTSYSHSGKQSLGHYLAFVVLFLLLGGIFLTITDSLQKQAFRSNAATLPVGSALPAEADCTTKVVKTAETIPGNQTANSTNVFATGYHLSGSPLGTYNAAYQSRVTGNFAGTTDEILQWGACKWGFDADTVRAIAAGLSKWQQSALADCNFQGQIQPETNGCQSVGIMRIKDANIPPTHAGTWPYAKNSTAFNVDYALGIIRACYEGKESSLAGGVTPYAAGDLNGCIGAWYSGAWHDNGAEGFILGVQGIQQSKEWTTYGTPAAPSGSTGAKTVPNTPITPSFFPLAPCPTCSSPSVSPVISSVVAPSSVTAPSAGAIAIVPSSIANPAPSTTPCSTSDTSIASDNAHHHHKHNGKVSNTMQIFLKFILQLLNLLLQLLGSSGQVSLPETSPLPSTAPAPCSSSGVPSVSPQLTTSPDITVAPVTSVAPSQATTILSPAPSGTN
jgi:hypothetical protein